MCSYRRLRHEYCSNNLILSVFTPPPPFVRLSGTVFSLRFHDTLDAREKVTRNFAGRASQIFQESVRWAPDVIRSHLIQYLIDVENSKTGLRHHTGKGSGG